MSIFPKHPISARAKICLAAITLSFLAHAAAVFGQSSGSYSLTWSTIDGGGGVSSGDVYSLSGTIGQPDAGKLSGGNYTLYGGFWGVAVALQEPGAPRLRIIRAGNQIILAWPDPAADFQLQETVTLVGPANPWADVSQTPNMVGNEKQVTVPASSNSRFFRLQKP